MDKMYEEFTTDEEKRAYFEMMYALIDDPVLTPEENELVKKMFNIPICISNSDKPKNDRSIKECTDGVIWRPQPYINT